MHHHKHVIHVISFNIMELWIKLIYFISIYFVLYVVTSINCHSDTSGIHVLTQAFVNREFL